MKTFAILFLFCFSTYGAVTSSTTNVVGDITTKVFERTAKDGKPEMRIETVYRGKTRILKILSRRTKEGTLAIESRGYFVDGKVVMSECENDGNGGFKSFLLYHPGTDSIEIFQRQPDGSVNPVSTQTLEVTKKQGDVVEEGLRKDFEKKDMTDREISDSLEQMRLKIQDLEKEKKDDKK